ncbi:MAG: DDE-type integrase/transposase/recombinase [Rhizobium sp.]|nr:DDE-type integrase/transposase/recombinase [Rhizobium sp.]
MTGVEPHSRRYQEPDHRYGARPPRSVAEQLEGKFTDTESYFVSEVSVYRLLKAHDLSTLPAYIVIKANDDFKDKTTRPNKMWQTDFTYSEVIGRGWFYLSTIRDDFSRYILASKLCTSMKVDDVTDTPNLALAASACNKVKVEHRPRLLSGNDRCYVASDLGGWLDTYKIEQVHGAPDHPQTQGKIERWHQTLKIRILLQNFFVKEDLEAQIAAFVEHFNHCRYRESLDNLSPGRRLFRTRPDQPARMGKDQTSYSQTATLEPLGQSGLNHQANRAGNFNLPSPKSFDSFDDGHNNLHSRKASEHQPTSEFVSSQSQA